jgi:hypothetical protein
VVLDDRPDSPGQSINERVAGLPGDAPSGIFGIVQLKIIEAGVDGDLSQGPDMHLDGAPDRMEGQEIVGEIVVNRPAARPDAVPQGRDQDRIRGVQAGNPVGIPGPQGREPEME